MLDSLIKLLLTILIKYRWINRTNSTSLLTNTYKLFIFIKEWINIYTSLAKCLLNCFVIFTTKINVYSVGWLDYWSSFTFQWLNRDTRRYAFNSLWWHEGRTGIRLVEFQTESFELFSDSIGTKDPITILSAFTMITEQIKYIQIYRKIWCFKEGPFSLVLRLIHMRVTFWNGFDELPALDHSSEVFEEIINNDLLIH